MSAKAGNVSKGTREPIGEVIAARRRSAWERLSWSRILVAAIIVFIFAPVVVVMITSVSGSDILVFPPEGYSLKWYARVGGFLVDGPDLKKGMAESLGTSVLLGVITCAINVFLGVPAAYAVVRGTRGKAFLDIFLTMPLVVPLVVVGIALMVLASWFRIDPWSRVIAAHAIITLPFMVRNCVAALHGVPRSVEEAASMLGAGPMRVLWRVVMPLMAPGMLAGIILVFSVSFNEITATFFLYSPSAKPFPMWLAEYMAFRLDPGLAAMMTMLLAVNVMLLFLLDRIIGVQRLVI